MSDALTVWPTVIPIPVNQNLDLGRNRVGMSGMKFLVNKMPELQNLVRAPLIWRDMCALYVWCHMCASALSKARHPSRAQVQLCLEANDLSSASVAGLCKCLTPGSAQRLPHLLHLDLSRNKICNLGAKVELAYTLACLMCGLRVNMRVLLDRVVFRHWGICCGATLAC